MSVSTITGFFGALLGEQNPNRYWLMGFVLCLVACVPRATRRMGGIGLIAVAAIMSISVFIRNAFVSFTPPH